jgi:hypothetical protein
MDILSLLIVFLIAVPFILIVESYLRFRRKVDQETLALWKETNRLLEQLLDKAK